MIVVQLLSACSTIRQVDNQRSSMAYSFLALGDSYTIGERVTPAERWPVQLVELLRERGIAITDPRIIATTGWTTDELDVAIARENPPGPFDLVSLLIGVNNQYRGRGLEEYRTQFAALLQQSIQFAGGKSGRVVVLSIPDWGVTPFAEGRDRQSIALQIDAFNRVKKEEADRLGVQYIDITPISRRATTDPELVAADGLHPSGAMYREWATLVLPVVMNMFQR